MTSATRRSPPALPLPCTLKPFDWAQSASGPGSIVTSSPHRAISSRLPPIRFAFRPGFVPSSMRVYDKADADAISTVGVDTLCMTYLRKQRLRELSVARGFYRDLYA